MERNRMSIHIETGNIFFKNQNRDESIYDFIYAKQNYEKKLIETNLTSNTNFDSCISDFLIGIKAAQKDKHDMLTNKNTNLCEQHEVMFHVYNIHTASLRTILKLTSIYFLKIMFLYFCIKR